MIDTTDALVLYRIRYSDKHHIACVYTRRHGRVSYIVPAVTERTARGRSSKSSLMARLVSPPAELELVVDHRAGRALQYIREVSLINPYQSLRVDPVKNSLILFLGELLYKVLPEPESDAALYDFLSQSFVRLEAAQCSTANFHLCFLWHLLLHLGFSPDRVLAYPSSGLSCPVWFDLDEGGYTMHQPAEGIPPSQAIFLPLFARINFSNYHFYRFNRAERREILSYLLAYYRKHLPHFGSLRSLAVLSDLFD